MIIIVGLRLRSLLDAQQRLPWRSRYVIGIQGVVNPRYCGFPSTSIPADTAGTLQHHCIPQYCMQHVAKAVYPSRAHLLWALGVRFTFWWIQKQKTILAIVERH